jgi:hypothetical protein
LPAAYSLHLLQGNVPMPIRWCSAVLAFALLAYPAAAREQRCGWLVNPTPGNWWLIDRQGE